MQLPELGVGIIYVPGLEPLIESGTGCVDVIEIEPQTLWHLREGSRDPYVFPQDALSYLQALPQPKILHSVGCGVGSTRAPPPAVGEGLAHAVKALEAPWISEHLSFTHFGPGEEAVHTGFMLPPLQTVEGAAAAARTIRAFADLLAAPFAVEPVANYLEMRDGELPDGEFVAHVVEQADCGILLDLHNLWTNERNGRQSVKEFLFAIPLDRVWEIHLAGGFDFEGYWLDAHSGAVPAPVREWAEELIPSLPNLKAVIYEIFPSFVPLFGLDNVERQLADIASIWARRPRAARPDPPPRDRVASHVAVAASTELKVSPGDWEDTLGGLVVFGAADGRLAEELSHDRAIALVRKLIWKFRAGAIVKSLSVLTRLIRLHCGEAVLERMLDDYFAGTPPQAFASEEAKGFVRYLRKRRLDIPYLGEIIRYEEAAMRAIEQSAPQYLLFSYDPRMLLESLAEGHVPEHLDSGQYELELTP